MLLNFIENFQHHESDVIATIYVSLPELSLIPRSFAPLVSDCSVFAYTASDQKLELGRPGNEAAQNWSYSQSETKMSGSAAAVSHEHS